MARIANTTGPDSKPIPNCPTKRTISADNGSQRRYAEQNTVAGVPTGPISGAGTQSPTNILPIQATQTTPPSTTPPPPPPRRPRRLRRAFLTLLLLSTLGYAGSVYYALHNDNFHDFFTQYIPFGEDSVAYFEEREFRRRFPSSSSSGGSGNVAARFGHDTPRGEQKITIGRSSGLKPKEAERKNQGDDLTSPGRHSSALSDNDKAEQKKAADKPKEDKGVSKSEVSGKEKTKDEKQVSAQSKAADPKKADAQKEEKKDGPMTIPGGPVVPKEVKAEAKAETKSAAPAAAAPPPPPPAAPPIPQIDHLTVPQATEPVVQDLVNLLNNIITAINADGTQATFASTLETAKQNLSTVINDVSTLKEKAQHHADTQIASAHTEFDTAAKELVRRLESEMKDLEVKWREEYENERGKLSESYQQKLSSELSAAKRVAATANENALLQQEIALQKRFMTHVRDAVESEREGRLSRLDSLASGVDELGKLSNEASSVLSQTLQTQHLQIALEALRSRLATQAATPTPFLNELLALKECSADSEVITAAIATLKPSAYQLGIPSPASLIDRFRRVASEVRKASLLPEDAGVASHAASAVLSRFMFTKKSERGLPEGGDVEATLARSEVLLEEGDLDSAVREMNSLRGWAGVLARDWVAAARGVLEVRMAVDVSSFPSSQPGFLQMDALPLGRFTLTLVGGLGYCY